VEVDDEEMYEATTDPAGILELEDVPNGGASAVRVHPAEPARSR